MATDLLQQSDFDFTRPIGPPPPVAAEDIDRLCEFLLAQPGWITAREITAALGLKERKVRQLAEHSDCRIVSGPGCPGYRHFNLCTVDELGHVANQIESQIKAMTRRLARLRNKAHSRIRHPL